jgi:hypothetical protein
MVAALVETIDFTLFILDREPSGREICGREREKRIRALLFTAWQPPCGPQTISAKYNRLHLGRRGRERSDGLDFLASLQLTARHNARFR